MLDLSYNSLHCVPPFTRYTNPYIMVLNVSYNVSIRGLPIPQGSL